jgi:predicted nucleotidyltransferase
MTDIYTVRKLFEDVVSDEVKNLIYSYTAFGSFARNEKLTAKSDIDTLLIVKSKLPFSEMSLLASALSKLSANLDKLPDNVILVKDEVYNILSPHMLLNVYSDGSLLYGKDITDDFREYLDSMGKIKLLNGLLSTLSLKRHWLRKHVLEMMGREHTEADVIFMCKNVFHLSREYIRYFRDPFFKGSLEDALHEFEQVFPYEDLRSIPRKFKLIKDEPDLKFNPREIVELAEMAFSFVELVTEMCEIEYLKQSGEKEIKLKVF